MSYNPLWENQTDVLSSITTGQNNNVDPGPLGSGVVNTLAAVWSISGFVGNGYRPPLHVMNQSGQVLTILNLSAGSSAGNQIATGSGANVTIASGGAVTFIYDVPNSVWRIVSKYP